MLTLGQAIRRLRDAGGLTQRQLAGLLETDATYLSHIEADRKEPSLTLLRSLAEELDVPPGVLLAFALFADLPEGQQERYRPIMNRMLSLAGKGLAGPTEDR
jgi:transcriptional regulator with XRE-family HTH domain